MACKNVFHKITTQPVNYSGNYPGAFRLGDDEYEIIGAHCSQKNMKECVKIKGPGYGEEDIQQCGRVEYEGLGIS